MMKKLAAALLTAGLMTLANAAETIYRGDSKDAANAICYYQGGRFYADSARKDCLYHHPGNMVGKGQTVKADSCLYRFMSDKIYKGFSVKKEDCIATIVETKVVKGNTLNAKIYDGFVIIRDRKENQIKGGTELAEYIVTRDAVNPVEVPVLFTIADNKIYKGDSTKPEDCVLTFTGSFNASRLLFMAIELPNLKK